MNNEIKATGLILESPKPTDYRLGGFTAIMPHDRLPDGNWSKYLPDGEKQYQENPYFDTMFCSTFAVVHCIEAQLNYLSSKNLLSGVQYDFLNSNNYYKDGKISLSKRFSGIVGGTTEKGAMVTQIAEGCRKFGCIPTNDLPFGGNSQAEYNNPAVITEEMRVKGKNFAAFFPIMYEWVFFDQDKDFSEEAMSKCEQALKQSPLVACIPLPATHALMLYDFRAPHYDIFDQYPPYYFNDVSHAIVHYAIKVYVKETAFSFETNLKVGDRHPDVAQLQKILNDASSPVALQGPGSKGKETIIFGDLTYIAVKKFQAVMGIPQTGYVGPLTRKILNGYLTSAAVFSVKPLPSGKIDRWCEAIKDHEGYYLPGRVAGYPEGSVSFINKNPGNLRFANQAKAIGKDSRNFAIFSTYDDGYQCLKDMLVNACTGKSQVYTPSMTLLEFFNVYAPSHENDTVAYANVVARKIGVSVYTQIKDLL